MKGKKKKAFISNEALNPEHFCFYILNKVLKITFIILVHIIFITVLHQN